MSSAGGGEVNGKAKHNLGRDLFSIQLEVLAYTYIIDTAHYVRAMSVGLGRVYQKCSSAGELSLDRLAGCSILVMSPSISNPHNLIEKPHYPIR